MSNALKKVYKEFRDTAFITIKKAENVGVTRAMLAMMVKDGSLVRLSRGVYGFPEQLEDTYALLQYRNLKVVFSDVTALYLHDLSDRVPQEYHVSVPQGYNASHLLKHHHNLKIHYVAKDSFEFGQIQMESYQGNQIFVYDKERCICELVKHKNKQDRQIFVDAIKQYFLSKDRDINKLIKYSEILSVEKEIRNYVEVLY